MNLHESLESIHQCLGSQAWSQAVTLCEKTLIVFPQEPTLYRLLGKALEHLGQIDQAIATYQQGLRRSSKDAAIHAELGRLYCQQERFALAIRHYQQALTIAPNWSDVHYNIGVIFHQLGQWQQACTYYQNALDAIPASSASDEEDQELKARQARAYWGLGVVQGQMGYPALAMAYYHKAIQSNPTHWPSYKNLAYLLGKRQAYDQAIQLYHQALEHCHKKAPIYAQLGRIYDEQEQTAEAVDAYETANRLEPGLAIAHYHMAKLWLRHQQYPQANQAFQKAADLDFNHSALASTWGATLLEQGKWAQALSLFRTSVSLQSNWIEAYCQRATKLASDHAAETVFDRVRMACADLLRRLLITTDSAGAIPALGRAYEAIATLFYDSRLFEQATEPLQKALWIAPKQTDLYLKLGHCLTAQQRWNGAIAIYQAGLMIAPSHARLQDAYTSVIKRQNQFHPQFYPSQILKGIYPRTLDWNKTSAQPPYPQPLLSLQSRVQIIDWTPHSSEHPKPLAATWRAEPPPQAALPLLPHRQSTAPDSKPCGGVTCSRCMDALIDSFHPIQRAPNIYQCSRQNSTAIPPHDTFVATIPQGRAWIAPRQNAWLVCNEIAIMTPDNYLLGDLSRFYPWYLPGCQNHSLSHHSICDRHDFPTLTTINGTVAILSSLSGNVYYHWMIDVLPRIGLLQKSQWSLDQIDWFVVNSLKSSFQKETLSTLGIPLEKIIESDRISHIKAQTLIVPSFPGHLDWVSPGTIDFLRHTFLSQKTSAIGQRPSVSNSVPPPSPIVSTPGSHPTSGKRIYISRTHANYRAVLNEDEVVNCLTALNFEIVQLETVSVTQQAQLFSQADVIISPHGSSLTNLVFCQPGTHVIELFTPHYIRTDYWMISQILKLNHTYLICQDFSCYPLRKLMYQTPLTEDIYVNIKDLNTVLELVLHR